MAQYEHRKLMMKVNQQLGSQEFYSLAYLMCVPDEIVEATQSDGDRTRVLRYLEKQNIIGPNNYRCLVDGLDTLGRQDLIVQIALEDPEGVVAKLPYIPQSIEPQQLAWLAKRESMLGRKEKYVGCMKDFIMIIHSQLAKENRFGAFFSRSNSALTSEQHLTLPQSQESVTAALTELSLFWKRWPTTIATYQQNGDTHKVKPLLSDCFSCFDRFNCELPPSWEMEAREYVVFDHKAQKHIAYLVMEALNSLHEISAEFIGEQPLKEARKRTQEVLFILANHTERYLIPIYKWLMALVHSTSQSAIDASKIYTTLKIIFSDHYEDITRNRDTLVRLFGVEVMDRISQELLRDNKDKDSDAKCDFDIPIHTSLVSTGSIVWHVALVMLAMMSLNYKVDHRALQQKLVEYIVSQRRNMMQIYVHTSRRREEGMQKELDHFAAICEQKISQLVGGAPEPLEIVQSLFNYKTS